MNLLKFSAMFGVLALGSGVALADTSSLNDFQSRVVPVLVQVDSHGNVTGASAAVMLPPQVNRLMLKNLGEMISKPATDKHGRAVSSQFVINLALQTSPRQQGDYDAQFTYLSATPVPPGSWHWVNVDGRRLELARANSSHRHASMPVFRDRGAYRQNVQTHNTSAPTQKPGNGH